MFVDGYHKEKVHIGLVDKHKHFMVVRLLDNGMVDVKTVCVGFSFSVLLFWEESPQIEVRRSTGRRCSCFPFYFGFAEGRSPAAIYIVDVLALCLEREDVVFCLLQSTLWNM